MLAPSAGAAASALPPDAPIALRRGGPAAPAFHPPEDVALPGALAALVARYDRPGPRYTSYPPITAWAPTDGAEYRRHLARVRERPDDLAVYVHLPFCAAKCLYCGCNAVVTHRTGVVDAYLARLEREADLVVDALGDGQRVSHVHWGGGTPNLLDDAQLRRAFAVVADRLDLSPAAELSVEADPRLVTPSQLDTLVALGFRRISFGVQDLDPEVQLAIGRPQPLAVVRSAVARARQAGFEGVHFDLIYGLPRQTRATFARTLADVAELAPERIACFGYAHVPWARHNQRRIDERELPGARARFALFDLAVERLVAAGYVWLGMDHFARPHDELALAQRAGRLRRDFMGYTTRPARHLLGLGASAIGEVDDAFVQNAAKLGDWQRAIDAGVLPAVRGHALSRDDRRRRQAIMGLMCDLAVPESLLLLPDGTPDRRAEVALDELARDGLVTRGDGMLRVTPTGRYFLRNVCMALDATLPGGGEDGPRFSRTV